MKKLILFSFVLLILYGCDKDPIVEFAPTITTCNVSNISYTTATVEFSIDNTNAVEEAGIVWDTKSTFDKNSNYVESSNGVGSHTINLTSLLLGATIYCKAYAKDRKGNYIYGNTLLFSTLQTTTPKLTTSSVNIITMSLASSGGYITDDGGLTVSTRGVCWSTSSNPTINLSTKTVDDSGSGTFTSIITGTNAKTTYYVRAYAINAKGTTYGNQQSFTSLADNTTITGTFTDSRDGNTYKTIKIGNQVWMAENLKYLPSVVGYATSSFAIAKYYVYGYNGTVVATAKATINYATYGVLYNLTAAINSCPTGWHLPTEFEWNILFNTLGYINSGDEPVGDFLKSKTGWDNPNTGNNYSGFTALPGGERYDTGFTNGTGFKYLGKQCNFWSSTVSDSEHSWMIGLSSSGNYYYSSFDYKRDGYSVRCIRDN